MSKRKILSLAMALSIVAIMAVGATLAYFTDTDKADNVFTMGNVEIDLVENFAPEASGAPVLAPGLDITKQVWVENKGTEEAYVRVHIAMPHDLDDGDPAFNASHNFLHFNFSEESVADGEWSWIPEYTEGTGYKGNGKGNWNYYETTIDEELYNVYVVTYRTAVQPGSRTATNAMEKVYLDPTVDGVTNDDNSVTYTDTKGNTVKLTAAELQNIQIKVFAEGTQIDTFKDPYEALNTAFGAPTAAANPWNNYGKQN